MIDRPARIVRVRRPTAGTTAALSAAAKKRDRVKELISLIGEKEEEAERLSRETKDLYPELLRLMQELRLSSESSDCYEGVITQPRSRSTTTVDTEKFFQAIGGDIHELLECVVVPITAARKLFGEKEISKFSTTTTPPEKDPIVVVQRK